MASDWLELEFPLGEHDPERVGEALEALGALAVTMTDGGDDPVYEPPPGATPLWRATRVRALFDPREDRAALRAGLAAALGVAESALPTHRFAELADREWAREWLAHFQPMRFGQRLWVVPTAYAPPEPGAVNLVLDPGLAFGTGTHPTTALCLEWLDGQGDALAGRTVLDYGCGSGILAIAAALLGAREVLAVDLDPQALEASAENAARNGVGERLRIGPPALAAGQRADLLVANILAGPLRELAPALMAALPSGAPFALSGILVDQAEEVAGAYRPFASLEAPVVRGDWVRLDGRRRSA